MQGQSNTYALGNDPTINIVHAVDIAISKIPRIKNPIAGTLDPVQRLAVKPKTILANAYYEVPVSAESYKDKVKRVKRELLDAGATLYGLLKSETRVLPKLLHPAEHVEAVIYGQHNSNSAMLVATDERIIYVDKKPIALMLDEVSYEVVSGIELDIHLFFASLILHTPVKNYNFRFVNMQCAEKFARHIEMHRLEREAKKQPSIELLPPQPQRKVINADYGWKNMAGYSWLPTEEDEIEKFQQTAS